MEQIAHSVCKERVKRYASFPDAADFVEFDASQGHDVFSCRTAQIVSLFTVCYEQLALLGAIFDTKMSIFGPKTGAYCRNFLQVAGLCAHSVP